MIGDHDANELLAKRYNYFYLNIVNATEERNTISMCILYSARAIAALPARF
jgi:hypothetical protein